MVGAAPISAAEMRTVTVLAACDAEAEVWWSECDVRSFVEAVRMDPTPARMEAFARQCFVEGAYRGAMNVIEGKPLSATAAPITAGDGADAEACGICNVAFKAGDPCLTDIDLGSVHAACCGPEREGYVNLDTGEPIGPDQPIPTPWNWSE